MGYIDPNETEVFPGTRGVRETDRALLVMLADGEEKWIPKSVIHDDSEVYEPHDEGELVVKAWFAEKEDMNPGKQRLAAKAPKPTRWSNAPAPRFEGDVQRAKGEGLSIDNLPQWSRKK